MIFQVHSEEGHGSRPTQHCTTTIVASGLLGPVQHLIVARLKERLGECQESRGRQVSLFSMV